MVEAEINSGVPANANRGLAECKGEWIKFIAGDDILVSTGIEEFVKKYEGGGDLVVCDLQRFHVDKETGGKYMEASILMKSGGKCYTLIWLLSKKAFSLLSL